jgi:hypothetical protein
MIKPKMMIWVGYVECTVKMRNSYKIFAKTFQGKKPLKKPREYYQNGSYMKMCTRFNWLHWKDLVNMVMNLTVP